MSGWKVFIGKGARGDLMTQERAGFGGAETLARMPDADGLEQPIHLGGTEGQELRPHGRRQCAGEWFIMFQPVGQRRLEELAAQRIAQEPESLERRQQHGGLVAGFWPGPFVGRRVERTVQEPQGGFAMAAAIEAELLEEAGLVGTPGMLIAAVDLGEMLAFGRQTQVRCFGNHE